MADIYEIKNEFLSVKISSVGAEIQSVKSKDGREYMWNGDPDVWAERAPLLFPICGALKDDKYVLNGREYTLEKHGFARHMEFECESICKDGAVFLLKATEETKKSFPFEFETRAAYTLKNKTLSVRYIVKNLSEETMYFSIGAHEGYACPEGIEAYSILFEKPYTLKSSLLDNSLLLDETTEIMNNSRVLPLDYKYFETDSPVFKNHGISKASLVKNDGSRSVTVEFPNHDYLLIWTMPDAKYLCIEPWCGICDRANSDYDITRKEGIIPLGCGETYEAEHKITFEK